MNRHHSLGLALAFAFIGCGVEEPPPQNPPPNNNNNNNPPITVPPPVVRPASVDEVTLGLESRTLPAQLVNDATVDVGVLAGGVTVIGGAQGLFEIGSGGFTQIDTNAVHAVAEYAPAGLVIATSAGLQVFDGALQLSPIQEVLMSETVEALAERGAELWIGTSAGLWIYDGAELVRFDGMSAVNSIHTYSSASAVVVHEGSAHKALRFENGAWNTQTLGDELAIERGILGPNGRIFGLKAGALFERVKVGEKVAWRAHSLSAATDSPGATGIQAWAIDPSTGALWIVGADSLYRIETSDGRVSKVSRPQNLGAVIAARVTLDGGLWLSDGTSLHRVGNAGEPANYASNIVPFAEANCIRCHATVGGIARPPLDTFESWVANIGKIITVLDEGRMPADQQPLRNGTVELIKKWRDDGLRP